MVPMANTSATISKLLNKARKVVGDFNLSNDKHKLNAIPRNIAITYVYQQLKGLKCARMEQIAEYIGVTAPAIRYVINQTYENADRYLDKYPEAADLLCPDMTKWSRGTVHILRDEKWYREHMPSVARADDYDISYDGEKYLYSAKSHTELANRLKLCRMACVITDIKVSGFDIIGVRIAQDAGRHLFRLCEFEG